MATLNLHLMLKYWATRWPDRIAVKCSGRTMSWGELDRNSDSIAGGLYESGIRKDDAVGILMSNRIEFLETMFAIFKIGGWVTLLNIRFTPREMAFPVANAGLKAVIVETALVDKLAEAEREMPDLQVFTTEPVDGCRTLESLRISEAPVPAIEVDRDDVALVCYTSGTTGFPKGAMLTHDNIREAGLACGIPSRMTYEDRILITAPLAYTWGSIQYLRECLVTGATATIVEPTNGTDRLIDVLTQDRITSWSNVPVLFERIAASPRFHTEDFTNLRMAVTGGATLHLLRSWQSVGVPITQGYGLTESTGHITLLFAEEAECRLGSSGRKVLNVDMCVADEEGRRLPPGVEGEVMLRGPTIMKGYINNPEETAKTMVGPWLKTGDTGVLDEEGYLRLIDRSKDMVRSGGLNIYPAEIERLLAGVPGLEEFAVIGVKDQRWGEVPMIVRTGSVSVDLQMLKDRCASELADYKRPHYLVDYGKPLPRTFSGKIMKRELREELSEPPESAILLKG